MRKVPKLRFKEFSDEWEEKKIEDIGEINPKSKSIPKKFVYIDLESVVDGQLKEKKIIEKEEAPSRAKRLVEKNDILYQMVRPYQQNNLYFSFNDELDYVASTGYAQIRTFYHNNSMYVYHLMHTKKFLDKVLERCTGTSYPAINSEDLSNISIKISKNINEQEKIANFLFSVDKKISLTEEKLELFREYKKGVMQKIFSQELRFKDSNGNDYPEWEEKRLNKIADIYDGTHQTPKYVEKGIPFYSVENITNNNFINTKFVSEEDYIENNKKRKIEKNDILMTRIGSIGKSKLIDWEIVADFYVSLALIKLKDKIYPSYINQFIKSSFFQKELDKRTLKVAFPQKINLTEIGECLIKLPILKEQQKIADFLSSIDSKIESAKKELEGLREFKKGLLQQMFI